jgi:hypothetical protein
MSTKYNSVKERCDFLADSMQLHNAEIRIWADDNEALVIFEIALFNDTSGALLSYPPARTSNLFTELIMSKRLTQNYNNEIKNLCFTCDCQEGVWLSSTIKDRKIVKTQMGW